MRLKLTQTYISAQLLLPQMSERKLLKKTVLDLDSIWNTALFFGNFFGSYHRGGLTLKRFLGKTSPKELLRSFLSNSVEIRITGNVTDFDLLTNVNDLELERAFITISESTEIICPKSSRIGNVGDGGWNVCEYGNFLPKKPCIIYSFGINNDWSFDDGAVTKYGCAVRSFDPSMSILDQRRNPNNIFLKEGLGGIDILLDNLWRINTLKTLQHIFRDDDKVIDYLKFDIEGSEWEVLNTSIRDGSLLKVKQVAFEIHTDEAYSKITPTFKLKHYLDLLKGLRELGFYRWYAHRNTLASKVASDRSGVPIWCCHEIVYINLNYL